MTPHPQTSVRAGPLQCSFDGADLTRISVAGRTLVGRMAPAVCDEQLQAIRGRVTWREVQGSGNGFTAAFLVEHDGPGLSIKTRVEYAGTEDGTITARLVGEPNRAIPRERVGWQVRHPADHAGAPVSLTFHDGRREDIAFPVQPCVEAVPAIRSLRVRLDGAGYALAADGGLFQLEDLRNLDHHAFSSRCQAGPGELRPGAVLDQRLTLRLSDEIQMPSPRPLERVEAISPTLCPPRLGGSWGWREPEPAERAQLARLGLSFLRVGVDPASPGWEEDLGAADRFAQGLGWSLELALDGERLSPDDLARLLPCLANLGSPVEAVLIAVGDQEQVDDAILADLAARLPPGCRLGLGSNRGFAGHNRRRQRAPLGGYLAWPVSTAGQGSATALENLPALEAQVWVGRTLAGLHGDVVVGPLAAPISSGGAEAAKALATTWLSGALAHLTRAERICLGPICGPEDLAGNGMAAVLEAWNGAVAVDTPVASDGLAVVRIARNDGSLRMIATNLGRFTQPLPIEGWNGPVRTIAGRQAERLGRVISLPSRAVVVVDQT